MIKIILLQTAFTLSLSGSENYELQISFCNTKPRKQASVLFISLPSLLLSACKQKTSPSFYLSPVSTLFYISCKGVFHEAYKALFHGKRIPSFIGLTDSSLQDMLRLFFITSSTISSHVKHLVHFTRFYGY